MSDLHIVRIVLTIHVPASSKLLYPTHHILGITTTNLLPAVSHILPYVSSQTSPFGPIIHCYKATINSSTRYTNSSGQYFNSSRHRNKTSQRYTN